MLIEKRDPMLKYPRAIKDEKTRLVLDWLLEFRFSSIDILAARLGQTPVNANRFFNSLIEDKILQTFQNVHTKHQRYVLLASAGVSYLEALGRDISNATTRISTLGKYAQVIHDLSVQQSVIRRLDDFKEVVWDRNISLPGQLDRPDALLKVDRPGNDYWTALEFERWRKDTKRIYMSFRNHTKHFENRLYAGVYYVFQSKADCDHYRKLFEVDSWPQYERNSKSGNLKPLESPFVPDRVPNLRKRFVFTHEPVEI